MQIHVERGTSHKVLSRLNETLDINACFVFIIEDNLYICVEITVASRYFTYIIFVLDDVVYNLLACLLSTVYSANVFLI